MTTREAILEAALELPREERIELCEQITHSIEKADLNELPGWDADVRARWIVEAKRRIEEFRRGEVETASHETVMAELDEQLSQ